MEIYCQKYFGWLALVCLGVSLSAAGAPNPAAPSNQITASQILDEFAKTQAQLKSFIVQIEGSTQVKVFSPEKWNGTSWYSSETRFDGLRVCTRERMWGRIVSWLQRSKGKPYYRSCLFDGQWHYWYNRSSWVPADAPDPRVRYGHLNMARPHARPPKNLTQHLHLGNSPFIGFLGVLPYDGERIDVRLREAAALQLRRNLEPAGYARSLCYVLEGNTPRGYYTVWLDPAHGFQMAKGIMRRDPGHLRGSAPIQAGDSDYSFVDNVRFGKFGDTWVPVEISCGMDAVIAGGRSSRESQRFQGKATKLVLNPDHEALRSFVPDDILNGASVYADGLNDEHGGLLKCYWREGKVVDKSGKVMLTPSPRLLELLPPTNQQPVARFVLPP